MSEGESNEKSDIFIARVVGASSKSVNIPDEVCRFCSIEHEDLIKLQIVEIKKTGIKKK